MTARLVAGGLAVVLAAGVVTAWSRTRTGHPAPRARPATPSATPAPVVPVGPARTGDVDGDRRPDRVQLVEQGADRTELTWRWGVRATLSGSGTHVVWRDYGAEAAEHQELPGLADVNGDRRAEIVVSPGASGSGRGYELLTYAAGRVLWVTGVARLRTGRNRGWGCDGRRLYTWSYRRTGDHMRGELEFYLLSGTRILPTNESSAFVWQPGTRTPNEFRGLAAGCGPLRG